jgi:hypothetical protein
MKQNKTVQSDILARLSTTAGQVFGNAAFEKTQVSRLLQNRSGNAAFEKNRVA